VNTEKGLAIGQANAGRLRAINVTTAESSDTMQKTVG